MKVLLGTVLLVFSIFALSYGLDVSQCHDNAKEIPNLNESVVVGNCKKVPCRLRKNTVVNLQIKIKPDKDVEKITNTIQAYILGVPLPFPGHDGTDGCNFIYSPDGKDKLGCPLKAGQDYLYKNSIEVLQVYPRVKAVIHWGLTLPDGSDLTCFEIPARITN